MGTLSNVKEKLAGKINELLGQDLVSPENLVYPLHKEMGDVSLPCFNLAKKTKKDPGQIAEDLRDEMEKSDIVDEAKSAGPYLNFFLNKEFLISKIIAEVDQGGAKYGHNKDGQEKRVLVEYSNVNTHKEYHVGHLRNICFGDFVVRILSANNFSSIPVSYVNDFGIHVAKTLWNLENYLKENYPEQDIKNLPDKQKGYILGKAYADAAQRIKKNPEVQEEVVGFMKKIEKREGEEYELWQETRSWNIKQFEEIYQELGVSFQDLFYESEHIEEGREIVEELLSKGILKKSQGAIIADLEKHGLGVLVIVRSDGTSTYPVADLALTKVKTEKHQPDRSIYVVDNRQTLYFKQLFKIFELAGYEQEMIHLSYDFVKLPGGMMASREGNVITYEELKQEVYQRALQETKKRHPDWPQEKLEETARKIGINAIKFEMLKVNPNNVITFDIDQALSFDGFTSAYIQYTNARIESIIKKTEGEEVDPEPGNYEKELKEEREIELIMKLGKYPEIVTTSGKKFDPSEIAKYLFELTQIFNDYYHSVPVLKSNTGTRKARLALLRAVSQVIKNGSDLLGLSQISEM